VQGDKGATGSTGPAGSDADVSGLTAVVTVVVRLDKGNPVVVDLDFVSGLCKSVSKEYYPRQ
jgi:hypothetical protein